MTNLQERRKRTGMSQFLLAQESGIARMRLSLAETGQMTLTEEEESAVHSALSAFIARRVREIALLSEENSALA